MNSDINLNALQENAQIASKLLKLMANPSRLLVLCYLAEKEYSVSELESKLGLSQSALSQHLALLRREQIVHTRRAAQTIYYSLLSEDVKALMNTLYERFCAN